MCIMEVRPGQHHSTIAQAQAHNTNTILGDLELFEVLLANCGEDKTEQMGTVIQLREDLHEIYSRMLDLWGTFLHREVHHGLGDAPVLDGAVTEQAVRDMIHEAVHHSQTHARTYETR